jgi:hypothetical protein
MLKALRTKSREELAAIKEFYKHHPVEFVDDWCFTFDPRNADVGLPTSVPFVLFARQADFLDWLKARWQAREDGLCEKSRDMGVSWLCVAFAVWMWLFWPGTVVGGSCGAGLLRLSVRPEPACFPR